jgi:hypothetical protein
VLHPIEECAGKKVVIKQKAVNAELADSSSVWSEEAGLREEGSSYTGTFPVRVSPHQPFKQVQEMQWLVEDGVEAQLIFEGDVLKQRISETGQMLHIKLTPGLLNFLFLYG